MDGYGLRILVVDDDSNTAMLTSQLLEHAGYNVIAVSNGVSALCELRKRHFDAVVTDYVMPFLNGMELLRRIQAEYAGTPVILVSGYPREDMDRFSLPPFAIIRKPYESETLLEVVRSAVDRASEPRTDLHDERQDDALPAVKHQGGAFCGSDINRGEKRTHSF